MAAANQKNLKVVVLGFDHGVVRYLLAPPDGKVKKIYGDAFDEEDQDYMPESEELMAGVSTHQEQLM